MELLRFNVLKWPRLLRSVQLVMPMERWEEVEIIF